VIEDGTGASEESLQVTPGQMGWMLVKHRWVSSVKSKMRESESLHLVTWQTHLYQFLVPITSLLYYGSVIQGYGPNVVREEGLF
jgi:hypothetical protein